MTSKKKFKFTFEITAIPYTEETYSLLGSHFFKEWHDNIFAKEDVQAVIQAAAYGAMQREMASQDERIRAHYSRVGEIIDEIRNSLKVVEEK